MAITLLFFTGCKVNEIGKLSREDLDMLMNQGHVLVKNSRDLDKLVEIDQEGREMLKTRQLQKDINAVFNYQETLARKSNIANWIHFLNSNLSKRLPNHKITTHSFRVGFARKHLEIHSSQYVSKIMGHQSPKTTRRYEID